MERLRLATLQDGTAWRAFTSPDNRTYYWNEAKNSSGKGADVLAAACSPLLCLAGHNRPFDAVPEMRVRQ
jgi:hypothetical protein